MCKLGHPEGETAWMKGASAEDIIYMVPTPSPSVLGHPFFYMAIWGSIE